MSTRRLILMGVLLVAAAAVTAQICAPDTRAPLAPTTVVYEHTGGATLATIIEPSDDGSLRAVDAATRASLWTFTPPEASTAPARNGLLTDVRVLRFDANDDGAIDSSDGDKVWLYVGLRRAGAAYYALDITQRDRPRMLWRIDAASLPGLGEAWSTPSIARVRIAGARQNGEHFVLIFGGGYVGPASDTGDTSGASALAANRVFMVDAATGHLLWAAGARGEAGTSAPDLVLAAMTSPIPAGVTVLDTDGDEFADRLYAIDVSGRIWRFDIWSGRERDALVTGGLLADLSDASPSGEPARSFFNAPDVALIQPQGAAPYYNVAVGSGDVVPSTPAVTSDRFYAVRDRAPFDARSQASYESMVPILAADLVDLTASLDGTLVPTDAAGWMLDLRAADEKVVAQSTTLNGVVMFTTFQPAEASDPCVVSGTTRVYAIRVDTGVSGADLNNDGEITLEDRSLTVAESGAPGALTVRIGGSDANGLVGSGTGGPGGVGSGGTGPEAPGVPRNASSPPQCLVGSTLLKTCVTADALVRTFWHRRGVK